MVFLVVASAYGIVALLFWYGHAKNIFPDPLVLPILLILMISGLGLAFYGIHQGAKRKSDSDELKTVVEVLKVFLSAAGSKAQRSDDSSKSA